MLKMIDLSKEATETIYMVFHVRMRTHSSLYIYTRLNIISPYEYHKLHSPVSLSKADGLIMQHFLLLYGLEGSRRYTGSRPIDS
jgi:hypothetical protein